jgi:hypothetical protein
MKFANLLALLGLLLLAACSAATESAGPTLEATAPAVTPTGTIPTAFPSAIETPPALITPRSTRTGPTAAATLYPAETPSVAVSPTETVKATLAVATPAIVYGRTTEGAYTYGASDAPVTLIDYSDFL